jgi:hypothetical protein
MKKTPEKDRAEKPAGRSGNTRRENPPMADMHGPISG